MFSQTLNVIINYLLAPVHSNQQYSGVGRGGAPGAGAPPYFKAASRINKQLELEIAKLAIHYFGKI